MRLLSILLGAACRPATAEDFALWRVRHEDSDEEDLEEWELEQGSLDMARHWAERGRG